MIKIKKIKTKNDKRKETKMCKFSRKYFDLEYQKKIDLIEDEYQRQIDSNNAEYRRQRDLAYTEYWKKRNPIDNEYKIMRAKRRKQT